MASPPQVNIDDLSGTFIMNYHLSDPIDPLLTLQGLSWFLRKAISLATITLTIKQYTTPADPPSLPPIPHIDITQVASGGISSTQENRTLDWHERPHSDRIFGNVRGRSRMFTGFGGGGAGDGDGGFEMVGPAGAFDARFLMGEVDREGKDEADADGKWGWLGERGGRHVHSWVVNVDDAGAGGGWTAEQVWGFEILAGKRFYTRRRIALLRGWSIELWGCLLSYCFLVFFVVVVNLASDGTFARLCYAPPPLCHDRQHTNLDDPSIHPFFIYTR